MNQKQIQIEEDLPELNKDVIEIEGGEWDMKMKRKCTQIKKWNCLQLWICGNRNPKIISQIKQIQFTRLQTINISGNQITSIEAFSTLNSPFLEKLFLNNNLLCTISPLIKTKFPKFSVLVLFKNKLSSLAYLPNLKTNENIDWLSLEVLKDIEMCSDVCWIMKMESIKMGVLHIVSGKRISQKSFVKKLRIKYKNINLHKLV